MINKDKLDKIANTIIEEMGDPKTSPKTPEALWELPGDENEIVNEQEYRDIFKRLSNES